MRSCPATSTCRLVPCGPPVTQMSLKAVLSKSKAAARVMSARPSPRRRRDRSASTTATMAAMTAPMMPPDQEVEAEVDGQHGRGEGTDPGKGRLAQRQLSGHARDQRDREEDDREGEAVVEDGLPGDGDPGQHGDAERRQEHPPQQCG